MLTRTKLLLLCVALFVLFITVDQWRRGSQVNGMATTEVVPVVSTADWKQFQSAPNKFSVLLPSLPQHASDSVPLPSGQGVIKYDMYLSQEKDGATFMISFIQYPQSYQITNSSELLDSVMKEMMNGNPNNKLQLVERSFFQNNPCLDFSIANNDVVIRSKAFLHEKTLVVLTAIDRNAKAVEEKFQKLVNSFVWNELTTLTK